MVFGKADAREKERADAKKTRSVRRLERVGCTRHQNTKQRRRKNRSKTCHYVRCLAVGPGRREHHTGRVGSSGSKRVQAQRQERADVWLSREAKRKTGEADSGNACPIEWNEEVGVGGGRDIPERGTRPPLRTYTQPCEGKPHAPAHQGQANASTHHRGEHTKERGEKKERMAEKLCRRRTKRLKRHERMRAHSELLFWFSSPCTSCAYCGISHQAMRSLPLGSGWAGG